MEEVKKIVVVSDGTGKTARRLLDAVLAQYSEQRVKFRIENTFQQVMTKKGVNKILKDIHNDYLVIFSIISYDLNKYFHTRLHEREILHLNVLGPMLQTMRKFLGVHPEYKPGLLQIIDDRYYKKIDAIGYTAEHDDGRGHRIEEAELVLVGLSRTCKTPISMYITCNYGLRVANIPIIPDETMTRQMLDRLSVVNPQVIVGLTMQPEALCRVREERAGLLIGNEVGREKIEVYHDLREIREETRFCRLLYDKQQWETIDVTKRAIEEIALEIIQELKIGLDQQLQ